TLSVFSSPTRTPPGSTLFPYTTLFRSMRTQPSEWSSETFSEPPRRMCRRISFWLSAPVPKMTIRPTGALVPFGRTVLNLPGGDRSEEHTSELQSRFDLVCRLLLEKKKQ